MEDEEEEEKKRSQDQGNKVWNFGFCMETTIGYGLYEIMYEFPCLVG